MSDDNDLVILRYAGGKPVNGPFSGAGEVIVATVFEPVQRIGTFSSYAAALEWCATFGPDRRTVLCPSFVDAPEYGNAEAHERN